MISLIARRLVSTLAALSLLSGPAALAKSSRKIQKASSVRGKRVDVPLTAQPQVSPQGLQALPYATVPAAQQILVPQQTMLPGPNMGIPTPMAYTPLLAIAIMQMLMKQGSAISTPSAPMSPAPPATSFTPDFSSSGTENTPIEDSSPTISAESTPESAAETVTEAISEKVSESIPLPEAAFPSGASVWDLANGTQAPFEFTNPIPASAKTEEVRTEIKSEALQCFNHAGAGAGVGKSAGALSIGDEACNAEVIGTDYIITNHHCIEKSRSKIRAMFGLGKNEAKRAFECQNVVAQNRKNRLDYAIIKCPGIGKYFPPIDIANRRPQVGEPIRIATHNFSEYGGIRKLTNLGNVQPLPQGYGLPKDSMSSSAYTEPGNSGSGVYDKNGKWIGLAWGGMTERGSKPTFFTPADKIVQDLETNYPEVKNQIFSDASKLANCRVQMANSAVAQVKQGVQ